MTLDAAIRLTEILLALAYLQQALEQLRPMPLFFAPRIVLCVMLLLGLWTPWVSLALLISGLFNLHRFQGPYNGGSDRMGLLILCALCLVRVLPPEYVFGYLALQVTLSYFIAGFVKITNREWRNGRALQDVFAFTIYPVSENLRALAARPQLLRVMSWAVMLFELAFPLTLINHTALLIGLAIAALFHLANACLFGLNRFFWTWLAAYPSLLWFQSRIF